MSDVVDLTVNGIAEQLYALIETIEREPHADIVSHHDWKAILIAAYQLEDAVKEKLL